MVKGDIILINFPFTDLSGNKLRPAIILIQSKLDLTVCFVSTQLFFKEPTDILLKPTYTNGIKKESIVRVSKIATLDKKLALGKIGSLNNHEMNELNLNLKLLLQLH